jgi:hypothetical protein
MITHTRSTALTLPVRGFALWYNNPESFPDLTISLDNRKTIVAHKAVLASNDVIKATITNASNFGDKDPNTILLGVDEDIELTELIIQLLYGKKINIAWETIVEFYVLLDKYQMKDVMESVFNMILDTPPKYIMQTYQAFKDAGGSHKDLEVRLVTSVKHIIKQKEYIKYSEIEMRKLISLCRYSRTDQANIINAVLEWGKNNNSVLPLLLEAAGKMMQACDPGKDEEIQSVEAAVTLEDGTPSFSCDHLVSFSICGLIWKVDCSGEPNHVNLFIASPKITVTDLKVTLTCIGEHDDGTKIFIDFGLKPMQKDCVISSKQRVRLVTKQKLSYKSTEISKWTINFKVESVTLTDHNRVPTRIVYL